MIQRTWRERAGLASWIWRLPVDGKISSQWVWEQVLRLVSAVKGFARAVGGALDTHSGEHEHEYVLPRDLDAFRSTILSCPDFYIVRLRMDLECVSLDGEPFTIVGGASISLFIDRGSAEEIDQNQTPTLHFTLNADIYDPDSSEDDNEAMAEANSPRLTHFLRRVESTGAEFLEVDGPYCPGVHRYGFDLRR